MEQIDDLLLDHQVPSIRKQATPILFVHGMWGGSWCFANYLRGAADDGWEVWAINLRGHGQSRPVPELGAVVLDDYVRDVADVLAKIGPAVVIGHSMGGLLAQIAATRGGVRAAAFLATAAPRGIVVLRWPALSRMPRYLGAMLGGRPFRPTDADAVALLLNRMTPAQRAEVLRRTVPDSGRVARALAFRPPVVDAARVRCPTLVVGAADDAITPPDVQRRIAKRYGAEYLEVEGHGHMFLLEDGWEAPLERVLAWARRATS